MVLDGGRWQLLVASVAKHLAQPAIVLLCARHSVKERKQINHSMGTINQTELELLRFSKEC